MRDQLRISGVCDAAVDDATLILSELLSNACRHGRPLSRDLGTSTGTGTRPVAGASAHAHAHAKSMDAVDGGVLAAWRMDAAGWLTVEVTDGGGPTRPAPAKPSVTAHGGRGLSIITELADDWGVREDARGEVTVWVVVHLDQAPLPSGRDEDSGQEQKQPTSPEQSASPEQSTTLGKSGKPGKSGGLEKQGKPGQSVQANPQPGQPNRIRGHASDGPACGTPAGSRRPLGSGGAVHAHRPGHAQGHRHGSEITAHLATRPVAAFPEHPGPTAPDKEPDR